MKKKSMQLIFSIFIIMGILLSFTSPIAATVSLDDSGGILMKWAVKPTEIYKTTIQNQEYDLEAACALLDDRDTRSMMSAMLETKLLILCGRAGELSRELDQGVVKSGPGNSIDAWMDSLVNNPGTDIGLSTTQSETSIRVNPNTGIICTAYNDSQHWAVGATGFSGFSRSTDGGVTFVDRGSFPPGGGGNNFGDPSLVWRESDGNFYYAALHTFGLGIWRSTDDCLNFSYLGMIHVSGGDDKEIMEVDNNPTSPYYGRFYVAWTDFNAGGRIYLTYSNNGTAWTTPLALSAPGIAVQGAWPAVAPNGDVYVSWVRWNPYYTGPIDIEVVRSTNGGASFTPVTNPMTGGVNPREVAATTSCGRPALNANIGDGIRYLPSPQFVVGPDGCLHVVYVRDPDGYNVGDVINAYYRRSCDNGATWGPEVLLNTDGTQRDQYFPTISVGPTNVVVSTWYDRRHDSGNYLIDYYKRYSHDGGVTWGPNIRVSDVSTPVPVLNPNFDPIVATCYYGDYDQQVQDAQFTYILWSDSRNTQNAHPDPDIWFEKELTFAETGILSGTVFDDSTLAPITYAFVEAQGPDPLLYFPTLANSNGQYDMVVVSDTYDVSAVAYGYEPNTIMGVDVLSGTVTTLDIPLTSKDFYTVEGTVTDINTGWPLYAVIDIAGYPGPPTWTDPVTGYYSISLSEDVTYTLHVSAYNPGYIPEIRSVGPLTSDTVEDFALDIDPLTCVAPGYEDVLLYIEDFESGFSNWTMDGLWNPENESDACGSLVAPFPSPSNDVYYGLDGVCDYDTGATNTGSLTMINPVSLPPSGDLALRFTSYEETECGGDCSWDNRHVEISDNGGGSWDSLGEGNFEDSWYVWGTDLSAYLGQNVLLRFRFDSVDSIGNSYFGWMVDDIRIATGCQPKPGGFVVGNVYDENIGEPLVGAMIRDENGDLTPAIPTPADPNLDDAFYSVFSPVGTHTFTATHTGVYGMDVDDVDVILNDVVWHDFGLPAGLLSPLPDAMDVPVLLGTDVTVPLTLTNLGGFDASFDIREIDKGSITLLDSNAPTIAACTVAIMADDGSGPNEITELHNTLDEFGIGWVDVMSTTEAYNAGANVLIDRYAAFNLPYSAIDNWLNDGLGYIELGDWPDWFSDSWEGQPAGTPLSLSVADASHPLADGLPPTWTGLGFWAYDWVSDAVGWVDDIAYPNIVEGQYATPHERVVSFEEYGTGRAVYIGLNTYGTLANPPDKQVLYNAITWSGECIGDVPWLSENPISGTIPATMDWVVDVTFDAHAPVITQTGEYYADLVVLNDTPYGKFPVPVTMTVVDTVIAALDLKPNSSLTGDVGTTVVHTLTVTNNGNLIDSFDISVSGNSWATTAPAQVMNLFPGQTKTFYVSVTVPIDAIDKAMDTATVTAFSHNSPTALDSVTLTTTAIGTSIYLPVAFKD
jgi:hypothetical protein